MRNTEKRRHIKQEKHRSNIDDEEVKGQMSNKSEIIDSLKDKIRKFEERAAESDKNSEILARLYECGVIDEDGEILLDNKKP